MTTDHDRPHWCEHDGLDALVPPPQRLFYIGQTSGNGLVTRGCPFSSTPGEPPDGTTHLPDRPGGTTDDDVR
jgi:hypothetical protein